MPKVTKHRRPKKVVRKKSRKVAGTKSRQRQYREDVNRLAIADKLGIASRYEPLDESGDGLKINIYGRSGTGKTTFWATFPKPILAIICSGSQRSGELKSIDTPALRKVITKFYLEDSEDLDAVVEEQERTERFKSVVLDHGSGLQDVVFREVTNLEEAPAQKAWGMATQQQYGQITAQMKERLRKFLSLQCHVAIVAQERGFNTDSDNEHIMPYVASALYPTVVGWLDPACDYIVQTYIRPKMVQRRAKVKGAKPRLVRGKGVEYCLRVAPHDVFTTKFRVPGGLGDVDAIVDPTFEKVQSLIQGER